MAFAVSTSLPVRLNTLTGATTVSTPLSGGDNLLVDTLVTGATGALNQSVTFVVGPGVASLTGSATWEITPSSGHGPRLTGVNIDIFDASNTLVASDVFQGLLADFATSSIALGSLAPGSYRLVATGNGVRDSSLDISLTFEAGDAGIPAVTQPVTSGSIVSATALAQPFAATDTLFLNTLTTGQTGALTQTVAFSVGAGVTGFTGSAAWEISNVTGFAPRLTGVNIDIFDSANALVASDSFSGVVDAFAFSTLAGSLAPGDYRLVATGTAVRDASLNVSLTFDGVPVASGVPGGDPATSVLFVAGLGLMSIAGCRMRRS